MIRTRASWRRTTSLAAGAAALALCADVFFAGLTETGEAQTLAADGVIAGSVTADRGEVRAFRVRAADTIHKITYTVFTSKGRYQIFNLPASRYNVQVVEDGFDSPVQQVEVRAGQTATANLALTAKAVQRPAENVELVDLDQLYPPGPGRQLLVQNCFGCHGPAGWHRRGGKTEDGWRQAVTNMMTWQGVKRVVAPPWVTPDKFTAQERETIIKYLAANFPPNHPRRDWKLDTLVRDEEALSQAIYVQYELPPPQGPNFANTGAPRRSPAEQSFPSLSRPGSLWVADNGASSILLVDPRNLDYTTRMREYKISHPANLNVSPHGVVETPTGLVYWTEYGPIEDNIGELDVKSGQIRRYSAPKTCCAGSHSLRADSKGNIWYTMIYGESKIGKFDATTKTIIEYEPIRGANWYGILVDEQDRVWAAGTGTPNIVMYDPRTDKWTKYPTTHGNRRIAMDSKGNIWTSQYFGNAVAMVDPNTGKVTEHTLPLKHGNVYEVRPDADDNIWAENAVYNSLVRLDRKTNRWTYFPYPAERQHTPKMELDSQGTLWFGLGGQLTAFKSKGNVPARRPASAGQAASAESYTPSRTPDGQPDIQGSWRADPGGSYSIEYMGLQALGGGVGEGRAAKAGPSRVVDPPDGRIPYQPWAAAKAKDIFDNHTDPRPDQLDPQARCWLQGVVRTTYQSQFQILQTPGQVVFVINWGHSYRVVPLDGSPHPPQNLKLFMGDSRGRWEGNTLVVDVTNNNHLTWFDVVGSFHSDALHVVQRFTIVDANTMNYEATIDDPKVYTRPWKMAFRLRRNPAPEEIWEEACHEGNRSLETILSRPRSDRQ